MTFAQAVGEIAAASDREMRFRSVPLDDIAAGMTASGLPDDMVKFLSYLFVEVLDGRNSHLADGVERALRRPARDFRDFARQAAAEGPWTGS